jgi:nitrous oxidase accessory protein NosD
MLTKADLSRLQIEVPAFPAQGAFNAAAQLTYDKSQTTLQQFIENAAPYSVIDLPPGEYVEEITIRKPLYIRGNGAATVTGLGNQDVFFVAADYVVLDGLAIKQGETRRGGAIVCQAGYLKVVNCRITAGSLSAISASAKATVEIDGCELFDSYNPGLMVQDSAIVQCQNTQVHDGRTNGILVTSEATLYLTNVKVFKHPQSGISVQGKAHLRAKQLDVYGNVQGGIEILTQGSVVIEDSSVHDQASGTGILVNGASGAIVRRTQFARNSMASLKVDHATVVRSEENRYADAESSVLIIVHDRSYVLSEGDYATGTGTAAIAVFNNGTFDGTKLTLENVAGAGALVYETGMMKLKDSKLVRSGKIGFQVRDASFIEFDGVEISEVPGALMILTEVSGFVRNSKFIGGGSIGVEVTQTEVFEFTNCHFEGQQGAGISLRGRNQLQFNQCKFNRCGQLGVDLMGKDCTPTFTGCELAGNGLFGFNLAKGCHPRIVETVITEAGRMGVSLSGASCTCQKVEIAKCASVGFALSDQAQAIFEGCNIHSNGMFGIQVNGQGAKFQASGTTFANHVGQTGISVIGLGGGAGFCTGCTFVNAMNPHIELRQGSTVTLENCDVGATTSGIGAQAHDGGILELSGTKFHGLSKFAVMVGENGVLKATNSTISECGVGGLYTNPGANVELTGCTFEKNGQYAMQLTGGIVKTSHCVIRNHSTFGIVVFHVCQFSDDQNQYSSNGQQDVFHQ